MLPRRSASVAFIAALITLAPTRGRAQAIGRGFDLERSGRLDSAAAFYLSTLRGNPTALSSLLGLERVLPQLGRMWELLPLAQRAVARDSTDDALRGLLVRTYVALDSPDSAAAVTGRWARARPADEAPYREWALALAEKRAIGEARQVLLDGRKALEQPGAFAVELAALAEQAGDWDGAAREWGTAVALAPAQSQTAVAQLGEAPADQRERIVRSLTARDKSPTAARVAAELVLGWGDPARAWNIFESTLEDRIAATVYALRRFADLAGALETPAAWRVRGLALSRFAALSSAPVAARARVEAARSFLQSGDAAAARAELERVAGDRTAPPDAQRRATATLISALIRDGQLDSAAARLRDGTGHRVGLDDRTALGATLAQAWIRRGRLERADSALANDSSVEALALHGWIALYRGDLREARARFRAAGPYAGDRGDATERTAMLALVERITGAGSPALGHALLVLEQGDSTAAIARLREAANQLPPMGGRADLLLLAGQVAAKVDGAWQVATELFDDVVRTGGSGAAPPAAELEWARMLAQRGRTADAVQHLEHLILTYPGSAVVPEARRELERVKGAIPRS